MDGRLPFVQPSNGVPWLIWLGRTGWRCEGCGERGTLPPFRGVREFARALGDLKREHAGCGTWVRPSR